MKNLIHLSWTPSYLYIPLNFAPSYGSTIGRWLEILHSNIAIVALVFAGLIIDLSNKRNPLLLLQCNYLPSRNHMVMNYFKSSHETSNLNGYYMYVIEHLFKNVFISHFSCTLYLKSFMIIYIV